MTETKLTKPQAEVLNSLDTRKLTPVDGQKRRSARWLVEAGYATESAGGGAFRLNTSGNALRKAIAKKRDKEIQGGGFISIPA